MNIWHSAPAYSLGGHISIISRLYITNFFIIDAPPSSDGPGPGNYDPNNPRLDVSRKWGYAYLTY